MNSLSSKKLVNSKFTKSRNTNTLIITLGFALVVIIFLVIIRFSTHVQTIEFFSPSVSSSLSSLSSSSTQSLLAKGMLNQLKSKMDRFVLECHQKYSSHPGIQRLYKRYHRKTKLYEASEPETYTLNKGEKMLICMRNHREKGQVHDDLNLLTFVGLHELAHVMSVTVHHTDEFWNNFKILLKLAAKWNYYKPIDYQYDNFNYCNMVIYDNPYFYEKSWRDRALDIHNILFN